jgi:hypothetical protein
MDVTLWPRGSGLDASGWVHICRRSDRDRADVVARNNFDEIIAPDQNDALFADTDPFYLVDGPSIPVVRRENKRMELPGSNQVSDLLYDAHLCPAVESSTYILIVKCYYNLRIDT